MKVVFEYKILSMRVGEKVRSESEKVKKFVGDSEKVKKFMRLDKKVRREKFL